MSKQERTHVKNCSSVVSVILAFTFLAAIGADVNAQTKVNAKEKLVTKNAKGTFEVKVVPLAADANVGDPSISRLSLDKQFSGDLTGGSKGQMLGIETGIKDSGGYVAAERFTGTLGGKKGSFSLQHSGTMQGGKFDLQIKVVPDSGTDELAGISGTMKIIIEKGKHFYEFSYTLPETK